MFSIGSHIARCFFITKVVYLPPVKLGVVLFDTKRRKPEKISGFPVGKSILQNQRFYEKDAADYPCVNSKKSPFDQL